MPRPRFHILRALRIQIKNGYMLEEPKEYGFLLKYPPLTRDSQPPLRTVKVVDATPYGKYYNKALQRNPLYRDESVYPAFWQDEPLAMILARKQYELIKAGVDEESAYQQAVRHVNDLESKSYERLHALREELAAQGAASPTIADMAVAQEIQEWKGRLENSSYADLSDEAQGELDYFLQTKVLKWNEVERERRMKDPTFVIQFNQLRKELFPDSAEAVQREKDQNTTLREKILLQQVGITEKSLTLSNAPFYYEDYVSYFMKVRSMPLLSRWSERDRESLSRWIIEVLAVKEVLSLGEREDSQKYLDCLRAQFFPMIRHPDRAMRFMPPSLTDIRKLLYTNDIGYKVDDGKLLIRRFYKLPLLLFPVETFVSKVVSDMDRAEELSADESKLLTEMDAAGLSPTLLPAVKKNIETHLKASFVPVYNGPSSVSGVDLSVLDVLLDGNVGSKSKQQRSKTEAGVAAATATAAATSAPVTVSSPNPSTPAAAPAEDAAIDVSAVFNRNKNEFLPPTKYVVSENEWAALVEKYVPTPRNLWEQHREDLLARSDATPLEEFKDEQALSVFKRIRMENEIVLQAKCTDDYNRKEWARRQNAHSHLISDDDAGVRSFPFFKFSQH